MITQNKEIDEGKKVDIVMGVQLLADFLEQIDTKDITFFDFTFGNTVKGYGDVTLKLTFKTHVRKSHAILSSIHDY